MVMCSDATSRAHLKMKTPHQSSTSAISRAATLQVCVNQPQNLREAASFKSENLIGSTERMRTKSHLLKPCVRRLTRSSKLPKGGLSTGFSRRLLQEVNVGQSSPSEGLSYVELNACREMIMTADKVTLMTHPQRSQQNQLSPITREVWMPHQQRSFNSPPISPVTSRCTPLGSLRTPGRPLRETNAHLVNFSRNLSHILLGKMHVLEAVKEVDSPLIRIKRGCSIAETPPPAKRRRH